MTDVHDSFYLSDDKDAHRVSSVSYSEDGRSVSTFCGNEFDIENRREITEIPIKLLRKDEVCVECERNHSFINYERFNFHKEEFAYKFFFRVTIRVGGNRGFTVSKTVGADTESEARSKIKSMYSATDEHKVHYLARSNQYGVWDVLVDNTGFDNS